MEVGARDVQGLPLLPKPAPRQSNAPMADKPCLPAMNPKAMAPGTYHTDLSGENIGARDGGTRMIQRINEERGRQKTMYLAHGANESKADRAWASPLTAHRQRAPALQVDNCVKISFNFI